MRITMHVEEDRGTKLEKSDGSMRALFSLRASACCVPSRAGHAVQSEAVPLRSALPDALERCFDAHRALLETRARRRVGQEDAEDLVCQCYLEARRSLARCRPGCDLLPWLTGILDNQTHLHLRRERRKQEESYSVTGCADDLELPDEQAAETAQWRAQQQRLYRRLAAVDLTARQYECIQRMLDGQTRLQIAAALHISPRMVGYHFQAALTHLRARREEDVFSDAQEMFCECARHAIYRKPHVFDNQGTSQERERRRRQCLQEEARREASRQTKDAPAQR